MKKRRVDIIAFIVPGAILAVWWIMTYNGSIPQYKLPSPQRIMIVFWDFATGIGDVTSYSGKMVENIGASTLRVLAGFALASLIGLTLGFLCGRIETIYRMLNPMIHAIKGIPGIGWLPLAIVWFGVGEGNTLFLITLASFFPIYVNAVHGAANVPVDIIRNGKMLGAKGVDLFTTIIVPASYKDILVGMRLGLGVAWAYLVLGELTGVSMGLGAIMADGRMMGNVDIVIVAMIIIAIMSKLSDLLLVKVFKIVYHNI